MKLWAALANAVTGWRLLLGSDLGWRERFALTAPGLTTAIFIYLFFAFLAVALTSMSVGMPSLLQIFLAVLVLSLPVLVLVGTVYTTRNFLRSDEPVLELLVPGTYALIAFLFAESLLAMLGGPVVMLAWLAGGYLLFRLARMAAGWTVGVAAAFAVLNIFALVVIRWALYMLSNAANLPS